MYVCVSGVRNVSFSENFAYVINERPLRDIRKSLQEINNTKFEFHRGVLSSKQSKEVCNVTYRILKPDNSKIHADPQKLNNFFNTTDQRRLNSKTKSQQHIENLIDNLPGIKNPLIIHIEFIQ